MGALTAHKPSPVACCRSSDVGREPDLLSAGSYVVIVLGYQGLAIDAIGTGINRFRLNTRTTKILRPPNMATASTVRATPGRAAPRRAS